MSKVKFTSVTTDRFVEKFNKASEKETQGLSRVAKANVKALCLYKAMMFDIIYESKVVFLNLNNKEF